LESKKKNKKTTIFFLVRELIGSTRMLWAGDTIWS